MRLGGIDKALHLPWPSQHRPYVALHVVRWGYELFGGRERSIYRIGLMAGRLFTDRGWSKWFEIRGRWSRAS